MSGDDFFFPDDEPYGISYGKWTTKWWEWCFSNPISMSPLTDESGKYSHLNQNGPVWYLCGTFGENKFPKRKCTVPPKKGILFPVINYIYVLDSRITSEYDLAQHVKRDIDDIVKLEVIVDNKVGRAYRVGSDPENFLLNIREDNKLGLSVGLNKASSDGYWVFLKPLPPGEHNIYFHGSCSGGARSATASYQIFTS